MMAWLRGDVQGNALSGFCLVFVWFLIILAGLDLVLWLAGVFDGLDGLHF